MRIGAERALGGAIVFLATAVGCGHVAEAPPLPEAVVVVDTNLPVPLVAGRLRVDLYSEDGAWFDTADFGRPDARDWPASFGVYSDDPSRERLVWVRLRAYPEGAVDTYQGERFRDIAADPFASVSGEPRPRLVRGGADVTPATEPSPLLTVDRLVQLRLRPDTKGRVRVLLHGSCVGTMVKMSADGVPAVGIAESCVRTEKKRELVVPEGADEAATPTDSLVGTWGMGTCPPAGEGDVRVCVPGGGTILGSRENSDYTPGSLNALDSSPPRVFALSPFFVDRDELTVGALRTLVANGYAGDLPIANDGALGQPTSTAKNAGCTWSAATKGRDDYPVTCAPFSAARDICRFRGGDLLTEAQWEHVATVAGHPSKVRYPWGQEPPTCDRGVWGRIPLETPTPPCKIGDGPRPIGEEASDVSPLGIHGLFGGVSEWVLDDADAFASATWASVAIVDPRAAKTGAGRVIRGGSWMSDAARPIYRYTLPDAAGHAPLGIRCAYPMEKR